MLRQKEDDGSPDRETDMSQTPSQKKREERVWNLKDCKMEIGSCGKKDDKDQYMTLDLVFKFLDEPNPRVVGE